MNIFVLDLDPVVAASYYIDKHCVKMPLEIAQMLCTAINLQGNETPYKPTHKNHPCSVWLRESLSNWNWLVLHGIAVAEEYTRRFGKRHKSQDVIDWCAEHLPKLNDIGLTKFAQAMPDEYRNDNVVLAYRNYYIGGKSQIATWKTNVPDWFVEYQLSQKS
jgi:Pyrimidine dimer DNA glycosylase